MGASTCCKRETSTTVTHNTFLVALFSILENRPSGSVDTGVCCDMIGPSSAVFRAGASHAAGKISSFLLVLAVMSLHFSMF